MAGDVINLRMAKKRLKRQDKETAAEKNRFEFGRSKAERDLTRARNDLAATRHEAGRRDDTDTKS